jgi:hypothetical protein
VTQNPKNTNSRHWRLQFLEEQTYGSSGQFLEPLHVPWLIAVDFPK